MANPMGMDGMPMEGHHVGRVEDGTTELVDQIVHRMIHADEIQAVQDVFQRDGLTGNPNAWTAKRISEGG